ncbi:MAG: hypothetical protein EXS40_07335 [Opitutaceae bacterium]|nr:hypothetical protein [Opitutaceae bacterium]
MQLHRRASHVPGSERRLRDDRSAAVFPALRRQLQHRRDQPSRPAANLFKIAGVTRPHPVVRSRLDKHAAVAVELPLQFPVNVVERRPRLAHHTQRFARAPPQALKRLA